MDLGKILSHSVRNIKSYGAKLNFSISKNPLYSISLISFGDSSRRGIYNKLNEQLPSEYSIDIFSQSNYFVLKCSGRSISMHDISRAMIDDDLSEQEQIELHSFGWLRSVSINIDRHWRQLIRAHIKFWLENFNKISIPAWHVAATSERIYNWVIHHEIISKTSDLDFVKNFTNSLFQQVKFLKRQLYLSLPLVEKTSLIRAIVIAQAAIDDWKGLQKIVEELECCIENYSDSFSLYGGIQNMLKLLRNLLDVQSILNYHKENAPANTAKLIVHLATAIRQTRHSDGGVSLFQSEFTPSPIYVDALLSKVKYSNNLEIDSGYLRLQSAGSLAFIDTKNKNFPLEFSFGTQRVILGTYLHFHGSHLQSAISKNSNYNLHNEKSNIWFCGQSEFLINDREVQFEKKIYIDQSGTDVRCEEILSISAFEATHHIILPGEILITPLENQNGFFIDHKHGTRWMWNFGANANYSFDFEKSGLINGQKMSFTLLSVNIDAETGNALRWSLKKM